MRTGKNLVLELFSGCARLSRACAKKGFKVWAYDIDLGPKCDLLDEKVVSKLRAYIRKHAKHIALVWMGTPCTSCLGRASWTVALLL